MSGLDKKIFNQNLLYHNPHGENLRKANIKIENSNLATQMHKYILQKLPPWSRVFKLQEYNISKINNNYLIVERIKNNEYTFPDEIIEEVEEKTCHEVASWFFHPLKLKGKTKHHLKSMLSEI